METIANELNSQGQSLHRCTEFLSNTPICSRIQKNACEGVGSLSLSVQAAAGGERAINEIRGFHIVFLKHLRRVHRSASRDGVGGGQ